MTDTNSAVKFDVNDAGIEWVEPYNRNRTAAGHFLENASAYLTSWEWPKPEWDRRDRAENVRRAEQAR